MKNMCNLKKYLTILGVSFLLTAACVTCDSSCNSTARFIPPAAKIMKNIFCGYDKRVRPTSDPNARTEVDVDFFPFYISVDEDWDAVHIAGHSNMTWEDNYLTWNVSKFKIATVRGSNLDIWIPEVISYDEGIKGFFKSEDSFIEKFVVINNEGQVTLNARILLTGYCNVSMYYWPHMEASCFVLAGTPNYDAGIKYNYKSSLDLKYLRNDSAWQLESITSYYDWYPSESDAERVYALAYRMRLTKYAKLYSSPILTPALILSILTLVPFWMQYSSLHRLILSLFTFFCQLIYLTVLGVHLEDSSSKDVMIVFFFKNSLLFSTIGIVVTLLQRSMLLRTNLPPAAFVNFIRLFPNSSSFKLLWFVFVGNVDSELIINVDEEISPEGKKKSVIQEWRILCNILDRIFFLLFFVSTIMLWFNLTP